MIVVIIRTDRLLLAPATPNDEHVLHGVFTQPGVRQFIFDGNEIAPEVTRETIGKSEALFAERGFGLWLARRRDSGALVGFGALWYFRDPPELELLYGVADDQVKQGYGREIARAVVGHGLTILKMPTIRASTDTGHAASRRLLEEIGFTFDRQEIVGGLNTVFYEISRPT